jgi:lysophospholipase L1-like esterase
LTDGRAIEPPDIDILVTPEKLRSMVQARADKPKDRYTPHDPPVRFAILGDSYTAGPGAGEPYGSSNHAPCYRTMGSWAPKLNNDFPFDVEHSMAFLACTGAKMDDVIDKQLTQLSDEQDERQDFMVITIGGNDIEFAKIVRICALNIGLPGSTTCEEQLKRSREIWHSQEFYDKMWKLYDEIFAKLDKDKPEEYCKNSQNISQQ